MENVTLKVDGMSCGGCVASVERVLGGARRGYSKGAAPVRGWPK
jgi:hypothetical protein